MPGITITTSVRTGPSSNTVRASSQAFFVGLAQRGPSDEAVLVGNLNEFEEMFGTYVTYSYLHPTVQTFFEEGGTQCYIARVVGPAATVADVSFTDGSSDVITITANGAGDWAHNLEVEIVASGDKRNVKFYYNGQLVYSTGLKASNTEIVNSINSSVVASKYASAVETTGGLVDASAAVALSGGDDDRDDNTVDTTFTAFADALDLFLDSYGVGVVACPETHAINEDLVAHANANNRVAFLHGASDDTVAEIKSVASDIQGGESAEHAAVFYPWVYIPTDIVGVRRLIPPDGFACAKRALAHNSVGPHQPGAGAIAASRFVSGVASDINRTVGDELDENNVNAIRVIANTVRVYGARSCSSDETNFRFITAQDVVNGVVFEAGNAVESLLFTPIDSRGAVFTAISDRLNLICFNMRKIGALYDGFDTMGNMVDNGYTVKCDSSLNSLTQLSTGTVRAQVGLRVTGVGDKIEVTIIKSNLTTSV